VENAEKVGGSSSKEADECTLRRRSALNAYHMDGFVCSIVKGVRASHSGGVGLNTYRYKPEVVW
jgi:hypothetical protein